jgi:hypothetical protein
MFTIEVFPNPPPPITIIFGRWWFAMISSIVEQRTVVLDILRLEIEVFLNGHSSTDINIVPLKRR